MTCWFSTAPTSLATTFVVSKDGRLLHVSVKGSQDGGWGLTQDYKRGASYHEAVDRWASAQGNDIVFCFVQFKNVELGHAPRVYLATVPEIARHLKRSRGGQGGTILYERYTYKRGVGAGTVDEMPPSWRLTAARIEALLSETG